MTERKSVLPKNDHLAISFYSLFAIASIVIWHTCLIHNTEFKRLQNKNAIRYVMPAIFILLLFSEKNYKTKKESTVFPPLFIWQHKQIHTPFFAH